MIPRSYPQVPTRVKIGLAPWFALVVIGLGVLHDHGVIDFPADSPRSSRPPAAGRDIAGNAGATPSRTALAEIPADYLALYRASARSCPGLPWGVLAGIGKVESNHGRSRAPGVSSGVNAFGCCAGPMQFNIRNGPPSTWDHYGDGTLAHVYQARYAIPAAAAMLCANGARGGRDLRGAVYAYNHAWWYVDQVLALARAYQAGGGR